MEIKGVKIKSQIKTIYEALFCVRTLIHMSKTEFSWILFLKKKRYPSDEGLA
jgi:hypothetical protein